MKKKTTGATRPSVSVEFSPAQLALFTAASKKTGASVGELVQATALFALTFNLDDGFGYFLPAQLWQYAIRGKVPDVDSDWGHYGFPYDENSPQNSVKNPKPAEEGGAS